MNGVIIDGVEVFGPAGIGLPVVGSNGAPTLPQPPPEFAPARPLTPLEPLQPHPTYPLSYPPVSLGAPTETGPRMIPVPHDPSYYIVRGGTGPATGVGDMTENEFATNGQWGVVDWAQRADVAASVDWSNVTNAPTFFGTKWFVGAGVPPYPYPGASPGDLYLDSITGDVYQLN
jgi:hypothetical protein